MSHNLTFSVSGHDIGFPYQTTTAETLRTLPGFTPLTGVTAVQAFEAVIAAQLKPLANVMAGIDALEQQDSLTPSESSRLHDLKKEFQAKATLNYDSVLSFRSKLDEALKSGATISLEST